MGRTRVLTGWPGSAAERRGRESDVRGKAPFSWRPQTILSTRILLEILGVFFRF